MDGIVIEGSFKGIRMQNDVENEIMYAVMHLFGKQQHRLRFQDTVLCHEEGSRRL
jgi:hypothetical protein